MKEETFEEKYKDLLKEYEDFTYIISHDFKAPLRGILNLSDWIIDDFKDQNYEEIEGNLNLIKNRVERLDKMVDGLKLLSRVERYDTEKTTFVLKKTVEKALKNCLGEFPNVKINVNDTADVEINTFEEKLAFTLEEIITNACKHATVEVLELNLNLEIVDGILKINLKGNDNSDVELNEEKLNQFFRVFYTEKNKEKTNNIGIGLSILKKIINFVKGDIKLSFEKNSGICVTIFWPLK